MTRPILKRGDSGAAVRELQRLLTSRGYPVATVGEFGSETQRGVRAFQSQNLDRHGNPLRIDGKVGPLTWWSLTHPKPAVPSSDKSPVDYRQLPPPRFGGTRIGRAALTTAIGELSADAREEGGNNRGPWVKKYLNGLVSEGNNWCAGFVSWCFANSRQGHAIPFEYSVGARRILSLGKARGWARPPASGYQPEPGDIVIWWRVHLSSWEGHTGLVHHAADGFLYTIEGNKSPKVQGFSYVLGQMEKLLGYVHVSDN